MDLITLNAKTREETGKGAARKLRQSNKIPAVLYGKQTDPLSLSLDTIEFSRIIRENGTSGLFLDLAVEGGKNRMVMLRELQMDTFGINFLHADLQEIDMDKKVSITIPVEAVGKSKGVKEGGILQIIRRELEISCKPSDAPETIQIDITDLDVGDSVHVNELDLGENISIPHEVNFTVITIIAPTSAEKESLEEEGEEVELEAQIETEDDDE